MQLQWRQRQHPSHYPRTQATLPQFGVNGALVDPTLALIEVASNDNWKNTQQSLIQTTGFAPSNAH